MKEFIIFACTDSTEVFFSKLRSAGLSYNLPCLLTFFIIPRVATVREKVLENENFSRSGKSQGITFSVREI